MIQDPYKVLGLTPGASDDEVKRAYRALAKKYHPDLHPGDEAAAKKMVDINAAYEQIRSGNTGGSTGASYNGSSYGGYSGQSGYGGGQGGYSGGQGGYGGYRGGSYDPFGFGFGFGGFGGGQRQSAHTNDSRFDNVVRLINSGYYEEAVRVLNSMGMRAAEWYYLSALANSGMGNRITALEHARKAVEMDPDNLDYRRTLSDLSSGSRAYREQSESRGYGGAMNSRMSSLLLCLCLNCLCSRFGLCWC